MIETRLRCSTDSRPGMRLGTWSTLRNTIRYKLVSRGLQWLHLTSKQSCKDGSVVGPLGTRECILEWVGVVFGA